MQSSRAQRGFTLVELMIVIAIVGVLASIAVPQYAQYVKRAKFSEALALVAPRKVAVHICTQETNELANCNGSGLATDYAGIPADVATNASPHIASVRTLAGVITARGKADVDEHTYVMTPEYEDGRVSWSTGGSCAAAGYCRSIP